MSPPIAKTVFLPQKAGSAHAVALLQAPQFNVDLIIWSTANLDPSEPSGVTSRDPGVWSAVTASGRGAPVGDPVPGPSQGGGVSVGLTAPRGPRPVYGPAAGQHEAQAALATAVQQLVHLQPERIPGQGGPPVSRWLR